MGFFSVIKRMMRNEIAADVSQNNGFDKLVEWWGIDQAKPKAINETTYFTCLKVLSETMGKMPLKFYQEDESGGRVRAPTNNAADMLMYRPNPIMSPAIFWSTLEANCEHYGNAYVWIQTTYVKKGRFGGDIVVKGFWPMQSECVDVLMDDAGIFGSKGQLYYHYTDPKTGQDYVYRQDSVLHFKTWLTWDGIMGKSVQDILKTTVGSAGYSQSYLNELYKSGMTASSTLQYTGELDDKLRAKLQKKYNDLLTGVKNAGKVVAIPVGFTLQPLTYKLTDAQYYEMRKYTALQIAAAFGVKPNQINDYEKSSYANSETQQLAFLVDTMLFRLTMYEQEINYKCLTHKERSKGFLFKFNEKVLLRANAESQMQVITSAIQNGVYTPNEGRHYLDLPSKEGGDVLIVNGNYVPLTSVGAAYGVSGEGGKD